VPWNKSYIYAFYLSYYYLVGRRLHKEYPSKLILYIKERVKTATTKNTYLLLCESFP
jgi:hypothetical protein